MDTGVCMRQASQSYFGELEYIIKDESMILEASPEK